MTVDDVLRAYWSAIDAADWAAVADLLHDDFSGRYPATGEHFDKAGFVRLNAEYPGRWRAEVVDVVASGGRVVTHTRVSDGHESHVVASFASVDAGRIAELVEIWAEGGLAPPADRRPVPGQ